MMLVQLKVQVLLRNFSFNYVIDSFRIYFNSNLHSAFLLHLHIGENNNTRGSLEAVNVNIFSWDNRWNNLALLTAIYYLTSKFEFVYESDIVSIPTLLYMAVVATCHA